MPKEKMTDTIPDKIKKEYRLVSLLSLHENALVFSLEKKKSSSKNATYTVHPDPDNGVLKVMPKSYFDKTLFNALQSLHHPLLLLPIEVIIEGDYVYALYPRLLSFSEYLSGESISLSAIQQWIKDMSQILSCLHGKNIFHGDIAPGNIYLDDEGHFYLGDFSSGRIQSLRQMIACTDKKKKTAATFPFSSAVDSRQDIFSFLTLLSKLLEASSSTEEKGNTILSALQDQTDTLLLELKKRKSFRLSFRQVCENLLSIIEEKGEEMTTFHQDFVLSAEKLDFLKETTKTLKKGAISSPFSFPSKAPVPVFALAFCTVIFLSAILYYAGIVRPFSSSISTANADTALAPTFPTDSGTILTPTSTANAGTALAPASTANAGTTLTPTPTAFGPIPTANAASNSTYFGEHQEKEILDISGKKYQEIPSSTGSNSSVKIIFAQGNRLKNLSSFSGYSTLEELYLDGNAVSDLSHLSAFPRLTTLGLSNNQLSDLSSLENSPSLRILDLSGHTKLSNFPSLGKLEKLEYLILTETNATNQDLQQLQKSLPRCTILY